MALALVLRNAVKCNGLGAGFLKTARLSPLKTYTTATTQRQVAAVKPLASLSSMVPASRQISVSAPRMANISNFTLIWSAERALSLVLLGVVPGAFFFPSQTMDALLAASVVLHTHWGIEAMITDYVRASIFGSTVPKIAHAAMFLLSVATLGGLFYFVYNDIGIVKSLQKFWAIKGADAKANEAAAKADEKKK